MILAGASCDDIYVIVLFSTFVGMAQGGSANMMDFVNIPVSIVLGVALGAAVRSAAAACSLKPRMPAWLLRPQQHRRLF